MSNLFSRTTSLTRMKCSRHLSERTLRCAISTLPVYFSNWFVVEQFPGSGLSSTSCSSCIVGLKAEVEFVVVGCSSTCSLDSVSDIHVGPPFCSVNCVKVEIPVCHFNQHRMREM